MHSVRTILGIVLLLLGAGYSEASSAVSKSSINLDPDIVSGLVGGLATGLAQVGDSLDQLLQSLGSGVGKLLDLIVEAVGNLLTTVGKTVKALLALVFKLLSGIPLIGKIFGKRKNEIIACNKDTSNDDLKKTLESLADCLKKPASDLVQDVSGFIQQLQKVLITLAEGLQKALEANKLGSTLENLVGALGSVLKGIFPTLKELLKPLGTILKDLLPLLTCVLGNVFNFVKQTLGGLGDYLGCAVKAIL